MKKEESATARQLAEAHSALSLAAALLLRLQSDGKGTLADQVLALLAGELKDLKDVHQGSIGPVPPKPL